jgi:hypothetical protein
LLFGVANLGEALHRTIVYVDGFNFYYRAIRGTPWKWLDSVALFQKVLGPQNTLLKVKYFTARVQPSPSDPNVNARQDTYLRALQAHCPLLDLSYGHFLRHRVKTPFRARRYISPRGGEDVLAGQPQGGRSASPRSLNHASSAETSSRTYSGGLSTANRMWCRR